MVYCLFFFFLFPLLCHSLSVLTKPALGLKSSQELRKMPNSRESKLIVNTLPCPRKLTQVLWKSVTCMRGQKKVWQPPDARLLPQQSLFYFPHSSCIRTNMCKHEVAGKARFQSTPPENAGWWKIQLTKSKSGFKKRLSDIVNLSFFPHSLYVSGCLLLVSLSFLFSHGYSS